MKKPRIGWLVYGIAAVCLVVFLTGCSMLGSVGGGAVAGGAVAGPPGAAAGGLGGMIGYGWTTIVQWWSDFWDGLFGNAPTPTQVQTVLDTFTVIKWVAVFAVLVIALKALMGPRYRELLLEFVKSLWTALTSFLLFKFTAGTQAAKEAATKAAQAAGMRHSR